MKKFFLLYLFLGLIIFSIFPNQIIKAVEIRPPTEHKTIQELIQSIIGFFRTAALIVAPLVIVVAAYHIIFSGGDPAKVNKARDAIIYVLVGLLIILMAEGIIALVVDVLKGKEQQTQRPEEVFHSSRKLLFYELRTLADLEQKN